MDNKLERYVIEGENYRIDMKESPRLDSQKSLAKHLVAFANRQGGTLLFGIRDGGSLEGVEIDEDEAIKKISEASSTWCKPPISFTTKMCTNKFDGMRMGDVLEANIESAYRTPHSIGTGIERTFYIRSGNESRPVTDPDELYWLFNRSLPVDTEYITNIHCIYNNKTLRPINVESLPKGYRYISDFLENLSEEDIQTLRSVQNGISRLIFECMPFVLLKSICDRPDFWIEYIDLTMSDIERGGTVIQNTDEIILNDLNNEHQPTHAEGPGRESIFSHISINPIDYLLSGHNTIVCPPGTEISIELIANVITRLHIDNEGAFNFYIDSAEQVNGPKQGLPDSHPLQTEDISNNDIRTVGTYFDFQARFEFSDQEDSRINQHEAFANGWAEFLQENWSMEERVKEDWKEVHRMSHQIRQLKEELRD